MAGRADLGGLWTWLRVQLFRLWTALLVVAVYAYLWVNGPEYLTWWKRATETLIEEACGLLPYPWGDRIESSIGDIGLWVQITLAILLLRVVAGGVALGVRHRRRGASPPRT